MLRDRLTDIETARAAYMCHRIADQVTPHHLTRHPECRAHFTLVETTAIDAYRTAYLDAINNTDTPAGASARDMAEHEQRHPPACRITEQTIADLIAWEAARRAAHEVNDQITAAYETLAA